MAKSKDNPWQFKFSFALSLVMLALILGYFAQAFMEIRKVRPVRVAIERVVDSREKPAETAADAPVAEDEGKPATLE